MSWVKKREKIFGDVTDRVTNVYQENIKKQKAKAAFNM